jgi:hypothetical protein
LNPASVGFSLIQKFADDHLNVVDGTSGNLFLRDINDLGMIAKRALNLYCFNFISHNPLPERYVIYHLLFFDVNERKGRSQKPESRIQNSEGKYFKRDVPVFI